MKGLLFIGFLFISACIGVSKAMDKETKAKFLIMNYLADSLDYSQSDLITFSKLDTNKSKSVMRFYMPYKANEYWISCTYKVKNRTHEALFGIDTTIKKIDTVVQKN